MLTVNDGAIDPPTFGAGFDTPNELELFSIGATADSPLHATKTEIRTINDANPKDLGRMKLISFSAPIELNGGGFLAAVHYHGRYR